VPPADPYRRPERADLFRAGTRTGRRRLQEVVRPPVRLNRRREALKSFLKRPYQRGGGPCQSAEGSAAAHAQGLGRGGQERPSGVEHGDQPEVENPDQDRDVLRSGSATQRLYIRFNHGNLGAVVRFQPHQAASPMPGSEAVRSERRSSQGSLHHGHQHPSSASPVWGLPSTALRW